MRVGLHTDFNTMAAESEVQERSEDLSYSDLDIFPDFLTSKSQELVSLQLDHNRITVVPRLIGTFCNLVSLDISSNQITVISPAIVRLQKLRTLIARNNQLDDDAIPKDMGRMQSLQVINFGGNRLTKLPQQFTELQSLKCIYIGANQITSVPAEIGNLQRLEVLYLGGNQLQELPAEVGLLTSLVSLILCDNRLQSLPNELSKLRSLQSLSLHNNMLSTLPPEIVTLDLVELSLRNNPLVMQFVQDMVYEPPPLLELAGRAAKMSSVFYSSQELPGNLVQYLDSAHSCVNPKCKGVYFTSRVEHIKFVDFCGKYRLPLLEYLCSPSCKRYPAVCCSSESESDSEPELVTKKKKVPTATLR